MKKSLLLFLLATNAYGYNPATREQQVEQTALLEDIKTNTGGGSGSNASVGTNGAAAPASSTQFGFNSAGNLVSVSAGNPLPITGSISATNPSVSATGAAVPAQATMIGGTDGTNLRALSTNSSGVLALPQGAATSANQTTIITAVQSLNGKVTTDYGSAGGGVRSAAQIGNETGAADFGNGNTSAQTIRVVTADDNVVQTITANGQYADSVYVNYEDEGPVDPGTPIDILITAADIRHFHIFDSSGHTVYLYADSSLIYIIPPGGPSAVVDVFVASGVTLSVAPADGTSITTGILVLTGLE